LEKILRDRYYLGYVIWGGKEHPVRHEPLIDPELFAQVQDVLARRRRGTRERVWRHYLKGLMWCARCGSRLVFEPARSRDGRVHCYYRCTRRQGGKCDLPRFPLAVIERAVEDHYATVAITETERAAIRERLADDLTARHSTAKALRQRLRAELTRLGTREDALLELVGNPDWPTAKLTQKMQEISLERDRINQRLADADTTDYAEAQRRINALADLLTDPRALYRALPDDHRQAFNDLCFDKLYVDADSPDAPHVDRADHTSALEPLRAYCAETSTHRPSGKKKSRDSRHGSQRAKSSNKAPSVGLTGLEPATP
jgi:site-specific DNA recombinase